MCTLPSQDQGTPSLYPSKMRTYGFQGYAAENKSYRSRCLMQELHGCAVLFAVGHWYPQGNSFRDNPFVSRQRAASGTQSIKYFETRTTHWHGKANNTLGMQGFCNAIASSPSTRLFPQPYLPQGSTCNRVPCPHLLCLSDLHVF